MKSYRYYIGFLFTVLFFACGTSYETPETPIDAGRQYIAAIYNGNFKRANQLIIEEDATKQYLSESIEKVFRSKDGFQKEALSKASIQINKIESLNDSETRIFFINAYSNLRDSLEVIKVNGLWKIKLRS